MKEVLEILASKYFSNGRQKSASQLERVKVRNAIIKLCDQYLENSDDSLIFEVLPNSLANAISVLKDEVLRSKYTIIQISETLFSAQMTLVEGL